MTKAILTVNDSRTMRDMLRATLAQAGYDVVQAENGQDGLDKLELKKPDLIITDVNMPVMDGIVFVERCRARPQTVATPILILTTESSDELKTRGREAGATGWIVKPFDPEKLLRVVEKVCP